MTEVFENLLNLSKVNITKEESLINVESIIDDILKSLEFQIHEKNVNVFKMGDFPEIKLDITNAKQSFQNLISIVIKYNENKNPEIYITGEENENSYSFSIKDNGLGIEKKYHGEVFEIFKRLHVSEEYEGSRIGLAICKKIVDKYNGKITVESVPGQGSTFSVNLPKTDVPA